MSDPNVERKKSYRWASASKVSYDGADWDSSEDDEAFDPNSPVDSNQHHGALPTLPKLDYSNNDTNGPDVSEKLEDKQEVSEEPISDEAVFELEEPLKQENITSPQIATVPDFNDYSSHNSGSTSISNQIATNESNLSLKKNSPSRDINEDLDNLMKQISKEMTPQMTSNNGVFQTDNATYDSINDQYLSAKGSQSPYVSHERLVNRSNSQQGSRISEGRSISDDDDDDAQSMEDMHVSRSGYFKAYLQSNEEDGEDDKEDNHHVDEVPELNHDEENHNEDTLSFTNSITYSNDDRDIVDNDSHSLAHTESPNRRSQEESDGEFRFQNKQGRQSLIDTSSDNEDEEASDDGIIYTNQNSSTVQSFTSAKTIEDETGNHKYDSTDHLDKTDEGVPENNNDVYNFGSSGSESENDDESGLKVSKSGYFSKIINQNDQVFSRKEYENEEKPEIHYYKEEDSDLSKAEDDRDSLSIPETIDDDARGAQPNFDGSKSMESITNQGDQSQHSADVGEDEDVTSISESINNDTHSLKTSNHETMGSENEPVVNSLKEGSQTDEEEDGIDDNNDANDSDNDDDNEDVKTTSSWQPDTESSRSGFVQETAKKLTPPAGFVFDENGKLVDLTPSSMKPRVVSTYSEIESGWNVFPTNRGNNGTNGDGADLETINDTKTLYDNSTIYNVPGLLTNNQNLPPLPSKIDPNLVKANHTESDSPSTYHTPIGGTTPLTGQSGNSMLPSQSTSNITVPNSKDSPRINLNNTMPELDINKLITSNNTHNMKLRQLNEYCDNLNNYDTGLQTWVRYSLNMPRGETTSMLDYKQSKIVRDAYENAEDMSKKHTVSNTVASVNHNVSHLKKKVFQHTLKPKTLFSSIGKGVKL